MKTFIVAITVLVAMLVGICLYSNYLTNTVEEFIDTVGQIQHAATDNCWELCKENTMKLKEKWENQKNVLCFFTDHGDLDEIEKAIYELRTSVAFLNTSDTILYSSKLSVLMERLLKNEQPTWENIL